MSKSGQLYYSEIEERDELIQELVDALRDVLHRFESAIGCGGKIEGDNDAMQNAKIALAKAAGK